ncbi:unnamed protein product [Closterium sp. NIES-54]
MLWLALGDSIAHDDLQRRMRVSCGCAQIRDYCFGRAAAVTSSLDNMRAAAPCAQLLFMAPVAIGSSGWRTTTAACAPLHYIACGARPSHTSSFRRRTAAAACLLCRDERPTAAPSGPLLLLLAGHYCYSWRPTAATLGGPLLLLLAAHDFLLPTELVDGSSCNWYTSTWRLLLHMAAAPAPGGCFCKRLPAPPDWWQQHHLVACSSSPDALQHLKPCSTGPAAVLSDALAACTGAAPALGGSGISSTCVTLVSSPSSA